MVNGLDNICLVPAVYSEIESRSQCNPYYLNGYMPIYIAPMSSLINEKNLDFFEKENFNCIIPRTVSWEIRFELLKKGVMVALGYKEAEKFYKQCRNKNIIINHQISICIDQANGHMKSLIQLCFDLKQFFGDQLYLMTGNIANPDTYILYALAGIDAVRVGIGSGNVCTTSVQTGIHYPMASLISKCNEYKKKLIDKGYKNTPDIVADGGFHRIDQIIKALALGADYVMIGEIIAKSKEACGDTKWDIVNGIHYDTRSYYGMSTEIAQKEVLSASWIKSDKNNIKMSEGAVKKVPVKYSIKEWKPAFIHALVSSMSYCNATKLEDYIGKVNYEIMSSEKINPNLEEAWFLK